MFRLCEPGKVAVVLWVLLALFILRVSGQAAVAALEFPYLPPMEQWYSGLIPYFVLLPIQLGLVVLLAWIAIDMSRKRGAFFRSRPLIFGRTIAWLGYLYAAAMVIRYIAQVALYPERRWLGGTIPIAFHFVLAAFVIVFGLHHRARSIAER